MPNEIQTPPRKIRLLLLEDHPPDTELALGELRRAGFAPEWQRVETEPGFLAALDPAPDLILADYSLPQFDGLGALARLRERGLDIPFILISGTVGEEVAVNALRQGADDYLLKDRLARLGSAVAHALKNKELREERRRAEAALRREKVFSDTVIDSVSGLFYVLDENGHFLRWNRALQELLGLSSDVLGQTRALDVVHEADREFIAGKMAEVFAHGHAEAEARLLAKDGTRHALLTGRRLNLDERVYLVGSGIDITARKQAENELRHVNRALLVLSECNQVLVRATDEPTLLKQICRVILEYGSYRMCWVGYAEHDASKTIRPVAHAGFDQGFLEKTHTTWADTERGRGPSGVAIRTGQMAVFNDLATHPDLAPWRQESARHGYASAVGLPLKVGSGTVGALVICAPEPNAFGKAELALLTELSDDLAFGIATLRTRAAHQQAQEALRTAQRHLEEAQRIAHVGSWEWDAATDTPAWSKELCAILEVDPTQPPPKVREQHRLYTSDSMERMHAAIATTMRTGTPYEIELERVRSDGSRRWLLARGEPWFDAEHRCIGLRGTALDITERKRAETALRENEERFRQLAENIREVFWLTDVAKSQMIYISPGYEAIWGRTCQSLYQSPGEWVEAIHPEDRERVLQAAISKQVAGGYNEEYRILRPDGSVRWIHDKAFPVKTAQGDVYRIVGIAEDITERRKNEHLALRSQRLEAIGTLAGGVAHDLNNALAPIMMGVELLRMQYPEASQVLDMFQTSAKRGADMVRQLLTFAKGAEGERVSVNLKHLVKEMESMIRGSFPKNIQVVVKCHPKLPTVLGDATQLHQVLLNLCVNARDAMPRGGTITLEAQGLDVDAIFASSLPDAKPGRYVALQVNDTGSGILPEILDRIFDPFFTTKGPDKGTGLGLSTVMGIVKGHGGFLQVSSQPGAGSRFTAYLPADRPTRDTELVAKAEAEFHGNGETILFVDDETAVRDVARAVLRRLNFKPLTAIDGPDGLIQAAEYRTDLRAIITDLQMPHMDGLAFVRALRRILPDIPVMVSSGRLEENEREQFKTLGVIAHLDKPFTEVQLAEALKGLLSPK